MSDALFQLLADHGVPILMLTAFLSCLALPVPASLMMLGAGAFAASGTLALSAVTSGALAGALAGDQVGYVIGRGGRTRLDRLVATRPKRAAILARAGALLRARGGIGVFLSRWLFSPLGPYVNLAAGAAGLGWARFTLWGAAGEALWVALYIGLGYVFTDNLAAVAEFARDISGLLVGLAMTAGSGLWLLRTLRDHRKKVPL